MKGSKTKDIDKTRVIESKINSPDKKLREISEETNLPISTVADILQKDLPEICKSSENVRKLIDTNNNLQSLGDDLIRVKLQNKEDNIRLSELVSLRESTFKQNRLIWWESTWILEVKWYNHLNDILNWQINEE